MDLWIKSNLTPTMVQLYSTSCFLLKKYFYIFNEMTLFCIRNILRWLIWNINATSTLINGQITNFGSMLVNVCKNQYLWIDVWNSNNFWVDVCFSTCDQYMSWPGPHSSVDVGIGCFSVQSLWIDDWRDTLFIHSFWTKLLKTIIN